jgi:hypothetical protein
MRRCHAVTTPTTTCSSPARTSPLQRTTTRRNTSTRRSSTTSPGGWPPARDSSPGSGSGKNQTRTRTAYRRRHRGDTKLPAFLANMRSSAPHRPQRFRQDHDHWEISGLAAEAMVTLQRAQSASCHGSRSAYCAHPGHPLVAHGISPKQRRGTGGFSGTSRPCLRRKPENQAGSARIWP